MQSPSIEKAEMICPTCNKLVVSKRPVAANGAGGLQTDFYRRDAGEIQSLPYLVHTCLVCGYSAYELDFENGEDITPTMKNRVFSELLPRVHPGMTGSEKHEFAAKVAEWRDKGLLAVANLLTRAAWCCEEEGDPEAERYYRLLAVQKYEEALLRSPDTLTSEERPMFTYLVGELWRRIGDEVKAVKWFTRVLFESTNFKRDEYYIKLAIDQINQPRDWI